jgi:hypothetical protein
MPRSKSWEYEIDAMTSDTPMAATTEIAVFFAIFMILFTINILYLYESVKADAL